MPAALPATTPVWGKILFTIGFAYAVNRLSAPKPRLLGGVARDQAITARGTTDPWRFIYGRARVGGTVVFASTYSDGNGTHTHVIVAIACHEVEEIGEIYFDDEPIGAGTDPANHLPSYSRYFGWLFFDKKLGTEDQLSLSEDKYPGQAYSGIAHETAGTWNAAHRGRGRAYLHFRLTGNDQVFPGGLPNITVDVRGYNKVYDPRDMSTGYSENAALIQADYLTNQLGVGAEYAELDEDQLIAAANICDEEMEKDIVTVLVNLPESADADGEIQFTEPRYAACGSFTLNDTPRDVLERLLSATGGVVSPTGQGKIGIYPAAYTGPAAESYGESEAAGAVQVQSRLSRRELFNGVRGVFLNPYAAFRSADYPPVKSAAFAALDGGEILFDLDLPFTISSSACQRLAKIELLKSRQQITVSYRAKLHALRSVPPDVVALTLPRFGWSGKEFECGECNIEPGGQDNPNVVVQLSLRETDPAIYEWDTDEESTLDPAPDTGLLSIFDDPRPWADPTAGRGPFWNLIWGGRFNGSTVDGVHPIWIITTPGSGTITEAYGNSHVADDVGGLWPWSNPGNAYDTDLDAYSEATVANNTTRLEVHFAAGTKSGRVVIKCQRTSGNYPNSNMLAEYSLDGGSTWNLIGNSGPSLGILTFKSGTLVDVDMSLLIARVSIGEGAGAGTASARYYEGYFEEDTLTTPWANINGGICTLFGGGSDYAIVERAIPGPQPRQNETIFTEGDTAVLFVQARSFDSPTADLEVIMTNKLTAQEWPLGIVPAAEIVEDWRVWVFRFEATDEIVGNIWVQVRSKFSGRTDVSAVGLYPGEDIPRQWYPHVDELRDSRWGDRRIGRPVRFDSGAWARMVGSRRRSDVEGSSI